MYRNCRRYATDDKVWMRILAAKDGMQFDNIALPRQCLKIVRYGHQICLGRQLVGRVTPVGVAKDA